MKHALLLICISIIFTSCFKSKPTNALHEVIEIEKETLHLIFSHNINGETHPCGCRHFPLGGLPQVAGKLNELKKSGEVILLDTGDMLFPSPKLPPTMKDSFTFGAENLSIGMSKLGLRYIVPGDQDLALGLDFLKKLLKDSSYQLLVSNLKDPNSLPHKRVVILEKDDHKIFLIGLVDPTILPHEMTRLFVKTSSAMDILMPELKKAGYDSKNTKHRLVLLSHSGMSNDQQLVKKYPKIDWVLGAHTQNFTKLPYEEGTTQLAQVLSRNHYMGEIEIKFDADKKNDKWVLHEIRDELKEKLKPNPFEDFITKHKEKVKNIQVKEQSGMALHTNSKAPKFQTASSCIECHEPQVDFWKQTPHSIAYATLINENEDKNLNCIGCHSVGFQEVRGYTFPKELLVIEDSKSIEKTKLNEIKKKYWNDISKVFKDVGSIRKLPKKKIKKLSSAWLKLDEKNKVTHNFANVQCLNCHSLHQEHPFAIPPEVSSQAKFQAIKEKCLNCHVPDQSPEWYEVLENGKAGRPKNELIDQKMKELSCPKREP